MTALLSLAGPVGGDLVGTFRYNRGIAETAARKLPLVGSKNLIERYTGINFYDPATEFAKERDKKRRNIFTKFSKTILGEKEERKKQFQTSFKSQFATGGLVSGPEVTDTKEDPADRVDPFTGEPYSDQMTRLGFNEGGGDMTRVDGTKKSSQGWLGPIKNNVTGQIMTEISMGIGPEDNQKLIPLLVPTLTQKEIEILQNMEIEGNIKNIPQSIKDKAIQHANEREEKGLNVFYSDQMARLGLQEGGEVTNRIIEINNALKELGYSKEARAAKMGNIGVETGYTYDYQQKQKNGDGYGLYQLDFQRPFYNKYLENNKLQDSARNQIMFTHEVLQGNDKIMGMNTKDRQALQEAFKSKDVSFITQMFSEKYEKPGVPHLEKRIEEANRLYQLLEE
jgi:hypothetical protein